MDQYINFKILGEVIPLCVCVCVGGGRGMGSGGGGWGIIGY